MENKNSKLAVLKATPNKQEVIRLDKTKLIRKFQRSEGNFDCCASASPYVRVCNQFKCLWRNECMTTAQD